MCPQQSPLHVVICGHIDHGKSTLIGRLLLDTKSLPTDRIKELKTISREFGDETQIAYLADQLKEERQRNITIETTQFFLHTPRRDYCLIDTPGHLEFIKNMISGASRADAAFLLVDLTEGPQEQTRRHTQLLHLLGIETIVVLINKMDSQGYAPESFHRISEQIHEIFNELRIVPYQIIPISAKFGENITRPSATMPWFSGPHLLKAMDRLAVTKTSDANRPLRFPVQDIYPINGEDIVVGRIAAGKISRTDDILILPKMVRAQIKSIKIFDQDRATARAPECVGITLKHKAAIRRGDVICSPDHDPGLKTLFAGNLIWLSSKPLVKNQTVKVQIATQSLRARVSRIHCRHDTSTFSLIQKDADSLQNNETAIVDFDLDTPGAVIESYQNLPELGRYTVEDEHGVLGAGTILTR